MSVSDNQVLLDILELLHKRISDDPASPGVDRAIIQTILQTSPKQMDDNMSYLAEKNLVALAGTVSGNGPLPRLRPTALKLVKIKNAIQISSLSLKPQARFMRKVKKRLSEQHNSKLVSLSRCQTLSSKPATKFSPLKCHPVRREK